MSDLSRHRRYLLWGAVFLALAVAFVLLLVPTGSLVTFDQRRSSLRTSPDGVAAWARSLERLGVPAVQRYSSFTRQAPRSGGLALLQPVITLSAAEVSIVLEWVRDGGTLVLAPQFRSLLLDSLDLDLDVALPEFGADLARDTLLEHEWTEPGLGGLTIATRGISVDSLREDRWVPLARSTRNDIVTLAWVPEGQGGVLVLADGEDVSNGALARSVAAVAVTRALADRLGPTDTLFFSEYHQAMDGGGGPMRETLGLARGTPLGRVVLHLAVAAFALLLVTSRRFGTPFPEWKEPRRSTLEHVEALAGIYRAAGSHRTAARQLIRGTARRLGVLHPSGEEPELEVLESWAARPELRASAERALAALRSDPPDLAALERALDAILAQQHTPDHLR